MTTSDGIRRRLEGQTDDARFETWMSLYNSDDPAIIHELDRLPSGTDPLLKIFFARFLAHVHEARAIGYLRQLLLNADLMVVQAAKKSFDRNACDDKIPKLMPVLQAPLSEAKMFAIERLSEAGVVEAVLPLLSMLLNADHELKLHILSNLRYLPDKRLLEDLKSHIRDQDDDIRFKTLLVYGALHEEGSRQARQVLIAALDDTSPRIRQSALWCLRRKPSRFDRHHLFRLARHDPDPLVRQEAVLGFSSFPSTHVIKELLAILVSDHNRLVVLKGEAVLLTLKPRALIRGLKAVLKTTDRKVSAKAMRLYAEFQKESRSFYRYLITGLKNSKNDKERIPFIEALGVLGNADALPHLESQLTGSSLTVYVTMSAVLTIWGRNPDFPILKFLRRTDFSPLILQMVLKHFSFIDVPVAQSPDLIQELVALLEHPNLSLRYLAAQILSRVPHIDVAESLLQMVLKEKDATSLDLLNENVGHLLASSPSLFAEIYEWHKDDQAALTLLLSYMKDIPLDESGIREILTNLFSSPHVFIMGHFLGELSEVISYYLVIQRLMVADLLVMLRPFSKRNLVLRTVLDKMKLRQGVVLRIPTETIEHDITQGADFDKELLIELLSYGDSETCVRLLTATACAETRTDLNRTAAQGLKRLMEFGL